MRHGRRATCGLSALCWVAGATVLVGVRGAEVAYVITEGVCAVAALALLRALADDRGPRRDERLISAIAIVGRGMIVILIGHLSTTNLGSPALQYDAILAALAVITIGQAWTMLARGPAVRLTVPQVNQPSPAGRANGELPSSSTA
ncbi:MAG: hypothetical protein M3Z84_03735 [Actinomycetota bacterium]|nr:hypothetical protein [Actinomycetota bacterium]